MVEKLESGELLYVPKIKCDKLNEKYDKEISKANKRVTFIELYQSRFYQSQQLKEEG